MPALHDLARAAGIDPAYKSWRNLPVTSSDEALLATLRALAPSLGFELPDRAAAPAALAALERARWAERCPPVVVGWGGRLIVPFRMPAEVDGDWEVVVTLESGDTIARHGRLFDLAADSHAWPESLGKVVHCMRHAPISGACPVGYHEIAWRCGDASGTSFAIVAPDKAYGGPGTGERRWGVFAPVYGLANAASGETGDLATLKELFTEVARRGGSYIATLPILAADLDPRDGAAPAFSPYSPVSRLFWNELYLDLAALARDSGMPVPVAPPVTGTRIDYVAQDTWRRAAFAPMAARLVGDPGAAAVLDAWATQHDVYDYAAFRALTEQRRATWLSWPTELRDHAPRVHTRADAIALGADPARVDAHVVAQCTMQRQLEELDAVADPAPALYLDLPVGVSCDAYEVWRWRDQFVTELAAGAPPDALFLGGQNWGLPPLSPSAQRRDRYRYFIRCVRHHMRVAGMLRIDHVMGLFRLYCVPAGFPATDGVYLRYHADELLAILTLESHRDKCALVGEDLGTVPDHVRPAMARHGMFRLHVGQWALPIKVGDAPTPAPPESVASLNTHDTATFAGWWNGADIDDRRALGLITDAQEAAERVTRERERTALLGFARGTTGGADLERAMLATTADLAAGPAEVVLVALDDLALDPAPHNVPGTSTERPNWQHRVSGWETALDPERATPIAAATIAAVAGARKR